MAKTIVDNAVAHPALIAFVISEVMALLPTKYSGIIETIIGLIKRK